ncbi:GT2 family glycosyltransferase [Nocardioides albertanoniae]|uniref:GT2 family glycosyltransferase n=1 Tax=Nocardioides albertanoniae TaxID=1175486 RepID=A0A543AA07_9ACTN|nr:glycosyltransferase [Nocardioides albertanoniae]TQL69405.1 GT2 family glycosyltransferase [Nocardioides albertanoniae]
MDDELKRIARGGLRRGRDLARKVYNDSPLYGRADDVRLLVDCPLFDHEWYAEQVGERLDRKRAARHYLEQDPAMPLAQPSPLFDPEFFVARLTPRLRKQMGDQDPFLYWLRAELWLQPTHPLFDTDGYTERRKTERFYGGAIGHYVDRGARNGRRANDWMEQVDGKFPDLRDWIRARRDDWLARQGGPQTWRPAIEQGSTVPVGRGRETTGTVSVIVDLGSSDELARQTLDSVAAQTGVRTEVVVIDRGLTPELGNLDELGDGVRVVAGDPDRAEVGVVAAFAQASGDFVAYVAGGEVWRPGRLARLVAAAEAGESPLVADVLERPWQPELRFAVDLPPASPGPDVPGPLMRVLLSRLLISAPLLAEVGGPRGDIGFGWAYDLALRLTSRAEAALVAEVGVERLQGINPRRPRHDRLQPDPFDLESWEDVVRNRAFIDWAELASRTPDPDVVSIVIPTYDDSILTVGAVEAVVEHGAGDKRVEVVVWDNGSSAGVSAVLDSLPLRFPEVKVVHSRVNHNFALGNDFAIPHVTGETVVFLNNDTTALEGWLEPLVAALAEPEVLAAQPLLLYPSGSVQSAGVVFPTFGGLPYNMLAEYPREDAAALEGHRFSALTGAALAMRYRDVVSLQGFDPIFTNGMEDVDLCHRLASIRSGSFRVVTSAEVVHHESKSKGRFARAPRNRLIYLDRWKGKLEPRDDVAAWAACGYQVVGRAAAGEPTGPAKTYAATRPIIVPMPRASVHEGVPQLRWAIKISAPGAPEGERWGDTHFARALARSLGRLGQSAVVDHHYEWERPNGQDDDVVLTLRGLSRYFPSPDGRINIGWVISHPDAVTRAEAAGFDRLLAAGPRWAERMSQRWGIRIDPLLQATDPEQFNPDRALPDSGHPVLFVGTSRDVERPIIHDAVAAGLPLSVYGHGWEPYIPRHHIKAQHMPNARLGAEYRAAGVVLNDHWADMREYGFISNRLFDAVASGARVISDDVAGLRDVFGDTVQVYESPDDLVKWSSMPDPSVVFGSEEHIRAEAARIHCDHGFDARARSLLDIALEERAKRGLS